MEPSLKVHPLRPKIISLLHDCNIEESCFVDMLDYAIKLFNDNDMGVDYYGYHNIDHELEVTYVTLLAMLKKYQEGKITKHELEHLYVSALLHDFDPSKNVDKPHEYAVLQFISADDTMIKYLDRGSIDVNVISILILRTTYPWSGKNKDDALLLIEDFFKKSNITNTEQKEHVLLLGNMLSLTDRISTYAMSDFNHSMRRAKMNAHSLGWSLMWTVRRSVTYFEALLDERLSQDILKSIPKPMRRNFMNTVQSFISLRRKEISIQADHIYESLKMQPVIEQMNTRTGDDFIATLKSLYEELPLPLQFDKENFEDSICDDNFIINTFRVGGHKGEIVGFAKGGPIEEYKFKQELNDINNGLRNTIFLEPIIMGRGYWGFRGTAMRNMFILQASSKEYTFLTSFGLRSDIEKKEVGYETAEFVTKFDPERWDYYRITL